MLLCSLILNELNLEQLFKKESCLISHFNFIEICCIFWGQIFHLFYFTKIEKNNISDGGCLLL